MTNRIEEIKDKVEKINPHPLSDIAFLLERVEELEKKLTVAVAALKEAAKWHGSDDPNGAAGELAFEVLKKIEGEEE